MKFIEELVEVKEHLFREVYANTTHIVKGTKVTKVLNRKVKFDQCTLNAYLELKDVEPNEYLTKLAEKEEVIPWLEEILAPEPTPPE